MIGARLRHGVRVGKYEWPVFEDSGERTGVLGGLIQTSEEVWIKTDQTLVTEEASDPIAPEAAASFREESAILDLPGTSG